MDKKSLLKLINRRHPDYVEFEAHWDFLNATYLGGRSWFNQNIFKYFKEGQDEFNERIKRAYRFNHSKEVVELVNKYIWRSDVVRSKDAPKSVKSFWAKATKNKWTIEQFMQIVSKQTSIYGRVWVVVDSNASSAGENVSKADAKKLGHRTYAYTVRPQDMLDMGYDEFDNLLWVLFRESVRDDSTFRHSGDLIYRYRVWSKTEWMLIELDDSEDTNGFFISDSGDNEIGIVPVFPADNLVSDGKYVSPSLIGDIAYLDRACANYLSNLDAIIQDQTFSQLAIPAQALINETDNDAEARMIALGTKRVFTFDSEGGVPMYLSPDPRQASIITDVVTKIINEIYHSIGLAAERSASDNSMGIDNSSGVAKAYDFERVNALLVGKGQSLQLIENKAVELALRFSGEWKEGYFDDKEKYVQYPLNYDIRGFQDEISISERIDLITAPLELKKFQLKRVAAKLYPEITKVEREKLDKSIDEMEEATDLLKTSFGAENDGTGTTTLPNEQNQASKDEEQSSSPNA
jgi:hypothetical protein